MAENTKIEWCHHTFNPWRGCMKVSDGCKNCYAETMSGRNHAVLGVWGKNGTRPIAAESYWKQPLKWNRDAEKAGERRRVFCGSLMDWAEGDDTMPKAAWDGVELARRRLFRLIGETPHLDWLLLTKRPENIYSTIWRAIDLDHEDNEWNICGDPHGLSVCSLKELYPNLWLGTSVEDQKTADERIPKLLDTPAAVRFLSMEPLLGEIDLLRYLSKEIPCYCGNITCDHDSVDWVIVGGESGPNARPVHPDWVRSIRDQCVAAGVSFFFKQWGEWVPFEETGQQPFYRDCATGMEYDGHGMDFIDVTTGEEGSFLGAKWMEAHDAIMYNRIHESDMGVSYLRLGKKKAGRLLDGREWNEFPEEKI